MEKIIFLDTNVILRFLIHDEINPHHTKQAKKIFLEIENQTYDVFLSHAIIVEVVYVLESFYKLTKPEVLNSLLPICLLASVIIPEKELIISALQHYATFTIDFTDAHTYITMQSQGISEVLTFDQKHFNRFEGITISSRTQL